MSDLKIGHKIQTGLTKYFYLVKFSLSQLLSQQIQVSYFDLNTQFHPEGLLKYSDVRTFIKKQPTIMAMYKSISTSLKDIRISGNHLIFARKNTNGNFHPV